MHLLLRLHEALALPCVRGCIGATQYGMRGPLASALRSQGPLCRSLRRWAAAGLAAATPGLPSALRSVASPADPGVSASASEQS